MIRFLATFCVFVLSFTMIVAQESEPPKPVDATPELLSLLDRSEKVLESVQKPEEKAMMLFELLTYELRLTDKGPAQKIIQKIQLLVPSIEKESTQQQIYTTLAYALMETGDRDASIRMAAKISQSVARTETQLNIAERIIDLDEKDKTDKPTDVTALLQAVIAGGKENKDPGMEAIGSALLGRQLAKQGRAEEARNAFREARNKARELEEIEERDVIALILRGEIQSGMIPEATALIESVQDEEKKQTFLGIVAITLARSGNFEGAKKFLEMLKAGDVKDNALIGIGIECATADKFDMMKELMNQLGQADRRAIFVNAVAPVLAEKNQLDILSSLGTETDNPSEFEMIGKVLQLEKLLEDKKFDEADQLIATLKDERLRQAGARHVVLARLRDGKTENIENLAAATLSPDEKESLKELEAQVKAVSEIQDPQEKMAAYLEILQAQLGLFDLKGAKQTLGMMNLLADKANDPIQLISNRMVLARFQAELGDKKAALENICKLLQYLSEVKDIGILRDLAEAEDAPEPTAEEDTTQPILNMKAPVDDSRIKEALVKLYLSIADMQAQIGDKVEAKKTLQLAETKIDEQIPVEKRFALLFIMSQMLGEFKP